MKVGDLAEIVGSTREFNGRLVEIISPFKERETHDHPDGVWCFRVRFADGQEMCAQPQSLEWVPPEQDPWLVISWDQCAWRPKTEKPRSDLAPRLFPWGRSR